MAGMNLGPAFGAGAASDALRQIVMDRLYQQMAQHQMGLQDAEFAANTDYRNRALDAENARIKASQDALNQNRAITQADHTANELDPGQSLTTPTAGILRAGGLSDLVNDNPEAAGSEFVAPGGQADFAPGQQPGLSFKGTAGQLRMLRQENDRVAAQQDIERNREAQQHKPIPIDTVQNGQPVRTFVDPTTIQPGDTFPQFEKPTKPDHADDNRLDRSYQYNRSALDKLSTPLEQTEAKIGDLNEMLSQGTPQSDALVAPKLLSVMVGGNGSGLRMNQAEIDRTVGGRSNWEALKAAANKWSLDPSTANSITPAQRQQIRALVQAAHAKNQKLLQAVNDAGDQLIAAPDVDTHRRVVADTRKRLQQINDGAEAGGAAPKVGDVKVFPNGAKGVWDGQGWVKQ